MDFSFKTDYSFLSIFAALLLAGLISYFYYRKSKLENSQKKIFTLLRFFSLFFIFSLLLSPAITFIKNTFENPVNVFLIDNSESLLIEKRDDKLKSLLSDKIKNLDAGNSENRYFLFSGNLYNEIKEKEFDTITFSGINNFNTDLTNSFYSLKEKISGSNLSSATVISDGIINSGGNPLTAARSLNIPVNYILTGDTVQKKDLVLKNIYYNKTVFIESNVPVNLEINSFNYDRNIKVNLYEEDKLIGYKDLKVDASQNNYNLNFNITSNIEKIAKYKVEIEGLDDEITLKNNYAEFFIKFVNNKFKVLVLAGGPSADFAFIKEEIQKIKNFETTFLTQKSATEFYENTMPDISGFDTYILIGFPTALTNQNILNEIKSSLDKENSSLMFFSSRNTDFKKLSILEDKLPFKVSSESDKEEETGIKSVSKIDNEIFKNQNLISPINSFPNIFKTASVFSVNPSSETFLLMSRNSEPAFVIQNSEKNHSAAFLAYGMYKWRLNKEKNNAGEVLNYLLASSIVAITNKDGKKSFNAETTKPVYSKFEDVIFSARIVNFNLQGGEKIKVDIKGNGLEKSLELNKKDNRFYEGTINIPVEGNYDYNASLYSQNNLVESIQGRFAIGENNFEYKLTRADNSLLNVLSNETGGRNFTGLNTNDINEALNKFNDRNKSEIKLRKNFELNVNPYFLGIIIFLLCLEWFLRKRNSLP